MQYLMMVYVDEQRWSELMMQRESAALIQRELWAWYEDRVRRGQISEAGRLREAATATTLREAKGRVLITDGPFAETKEVLGGFHLLECKDRAEAIAIAETFPGLKLHSITVEVRAVMSDEEEKHRWN